MDPINRYDYPVVSTDELMQRIYRVDYIRKNISRDALYTQLAEECVELAHAALKMTRLYRDDDQTIDEESMCENLVEEFNDVLNLIDVLGYNQFGARCIMDAKINRWYERLTSKEKDHGDNR